MKPLTNWLAGAGIGAGLAYYFDPALGNRRRKLIRDQMIHAVTQTCRGADATWRDFRHRVTGTAAELRGMFRRDEASDPLLVARVRSKLGRYSSHPSSIEVSAHDGCVTLKGPILAHEAGDLLAAVRAVRGVRDVEDQLELHATRANISALQGGQPRIGEPSDLMQTNWAPATRVLTGATGLLLMANCLKQRTPGAVALGTIGFGLFLRATTNLETRRLFGLTESRRGIDIEKTIAIARPVEEVFALLSNPENYPHFTESIRAVRNLGNGRYHKTVAGPAGVEIHLEEFITQSVPNELIACRSEPGSTIKYSMQTRFEKLDESSTRVQVRATYNPPFGILSHLTGRMAGFDAKSQLDDVLLRAKSFLETGRQPHDAADHTPLDIHVGAV